MFQQPTMLLFNVLEDGGGWGERDDMVDSYKFVKNINREKKVSISFIILFKSGNFWIDKKKYFFM